LFEQLLKVDENYREENLKNALQKSSGGVGLFAESQRRQDRKKQQEIDSLKSEIANIKSSRLWRLRNKVNKHLRR
jgi:hypothetical protein